MAQILKNKLLQGNIIKLAAEVDFIDEAIPEKGINAAAETEGKRHF